jgi:molybdenum cofactor cytidylyltransferase
MISAGHVSAIVLAAGEATRFGSPKALAPLGSRPLLQRVLDVASRLGFVEVLVVLGRDVDAIERELAWRDEKRLVNPNPEAGLSSSLKIGLGAVDPASQAAVVLLGDQPMVREAVIAALLAGFDAAGRPIVAPRYADGGGPNPLLIARSAWVLAQDVKGDRGLGPVLRAHPDLVREIEMPGSNPDVDTPEDLARLESSIGQ